MSELQPGDKVKFLNASGGGTVMRVIDSRTVSVMTYDGFEIPTLAGELVKIDSKEPSARYFEDRNAPAFAGVPDTSAGAVERNSGPLPDQARGTRKVEEIFLAFVPHDQKWLITGPVDVTLVNNSAYDILYCIFRKTPTGHFEGADYGNVFADSSHVLSTINREQLTHWTDGVIQFLFYRDQLNEVLSPFNAEFSIDGKRFFKEGNYRSHTVLRDKGIVLRVMVIDEQAHRVAPAGEMPVAASGRTGSNDEAPLIFSHRTGEAEAEVDLHIHELIDDPANLEKSEILEFQRRYFIRCLDSAMANRFRKVTFIHGIGNGTLRNVLTDHLKKQEGITFQDAPMSKYGAGALEVRLPANE